MALTVADVRARVETDFDDPTLQRILDAAVEDVNRHSGDPTAQSETHLAAGSRQLSLARRAANISSVTERSTLDADAVTLSANDYRSVGDYRLLRVPGGDNSSFCWGAEVVIAYQPEIDQALRDRVTLDVVQMDVEFRALQEEDAGDWSGSYEDYAERREGLLHQVREGRSPVL